MGSPRTAKRTTIREDWNPGDDLKLFASERGVDHEDEAPKFRDYHMAHGTLMADWNAAWRTWVRNTASWSLRKAAKPPLIEAAEAADPNDPWWISMWAPTLRDATLEPVHGVLTLCLGGYAVGPAARDACQAAKIPPDQRVDLEPVADWLRLGISPDGPDGFIETILTSTKRPDRPNLRYYGPRILARAAKA